jgi:hypothetical protein
VNAWIPESTKNPPPSAECRRHELPEAFQNRAKGVLGGLHHEYWLEKWQPRIQTECDGTTLLDARKGGRTAARDSSTTAARESAARPPGNYFTCSALPLYGVDDEERPCSACKSLLRLLGVGGLTCGLPQVRSLQFPDRPKTVPMIRYQETARHFLPVLGHFFLPSRFQICLLLAVTALFLTIRPPACGSGDRDAGSETGADCQGSEVLEPNPASAAFQNHCGLRATVTWERGVK